MTKALNVVWEEVKRLSKTDQENIGRHVLNHVEKLRLLRADIDKGARSLDAGKGRELDIDDVLSRVHARRRTMGCRAFGRPKRRTTSLIFGNIFG